MKVDHNRRRRFSCWSCHFGFPMIRSSWWHPCLQRQCQRQRDGCPTRRFSLLWRRIENHLCLDRRLPERNHRRMISRAVGWVDMPVTYHWQNTWTGMLQGEVFIFEFVSVDGFSTSSIVVGEVTTLAHEVWNDTMECWALVAETFLACAQCAEIFSSFWDHVGTKLKWKKFLINYWSLLKIE